MPLPDKPEDVLREKEKIYTVLSGYALGAARILQCLPEKPFANWEQYQQFELHNGYKVLDDFLHERAAREISGLLDALKQNHSVDASRIQQAVEFYYAAADKYVSAASEVEWLRTKT